MCIGVLVGCFRAYTVKRGDSICCGAFLIRGAAFSL
jgi:hypothetical protein